MASRATTVIDIVAQVSDETASGARSAERNVSNLERSMQKLAKQIQGMKGNSKLEVRATLKDMASAGIQKVAAAGKSIAGKAWTVTLKAVDLVTAPFKKVASLVTSPIASAAAFAGVSVGLADTVETFKGFEQGMANVKAISGATGKDFADLEETAKRLGETTQFSAAQAAEAMESLAMAGWKSKDIIAGMPGLLDLAAAGSVDLATASDVTASALAQFGLEASEAGRVSDVLAATATNSKTDVYGLGESLKYAGPLAGSLGYSLEDVSVALGVMGNNAIDASSAGTALRGMLARMSKQGELTAEEGDAVAEAMKKVGVSLTDSSGKSKSLLTVMQELRKGFAGMTEGEKAATAANLAGQEAMSGLLAIVNASDEDFEKLTGAIQGSTGAAKEMAGVKMDTLQGSLYYLQSAAEGVKIAIGEKLQPYLKDLIDWVTSKMPDIQSAVGGAVDWITGKIDAVKESVREMTGGPEWQQAETLWDKIKIAWDTLIAEPFDEWWNGTGKAWLADKAASIGEGLGTALHDGILGLLGVDASGAMSDGSDIGRSFAEGFLKGFDGEEVAEAIANAVKDALKFLIKDAATLLPGGEESSGTGAMSAGILAYGGLKVGKAGYRAFKTGKDVWDGAKAVGGAIGNVTGISEGIRIAKAAKTGGAAAQSAMALAEGGALGTGARIGAKGAKLASTVGKAASAGSKAVPIAGGAISLASMGLDAYSGTKKAEEWNGSDSAGSKVAAGVGAFLGGTGGGVTGDESVGRKALDVGGGAMNGASVGAAIGTMINPGAGTAIGAGIGAGVGALGAAVGGENISKGLSAAGDAIKGFFTETVPEKFGEFKEGAAEFFTESVPQGVSAAGEKIGGFLTETVPEKFGEFKDGASEFFTESVPGAVSAAGEKIGGFLTETVPGKFGELADGIGAFLTEDVPYAIGYAAGRLTVFFTETIPEKFGELADGIGAFFTETIPSALETVGETLTTFFTETVPEFFGNLWDGVVSFLTETVPAALETVGEALTTFFTETVPAFFGNVWDGVSAFLTETIPSALETVGEALTTFFTETVPEFFGNLWDGVVSFLTETVPAALETVGEALTTFFTETVPEFFGNLWDGITDFFTETIPGAIASVGASISGFFSDIGAKVREFIGGIWDRVTGAFSGGYEAGKKGHADGGIMTSPHVGLVAEDGAEAIIPLSGKRRGRGISVWERAGEMLGVLPHADGGVFGAPPTGQEGGGAMEPVPARGEAGSGAAAGTGGLSVTIGEVSFDVSIDAAGQDPQALADAIRGNIRGMTDEIAYQLANALQQAFSNTPRTAWEG